MARGIKLLATQFAALYVKNVLVAWRARRATILRLVAPFLFLLLALVIDRALQADSGAQSTFNDVKRPESNGIAPIPQCSEDLFIGSKACQELAFSPNNRVATEIMGNVTSRNSKRISAIGFTDRAAVQGFLLNNSDYLLAAVHFIFDNDNSPNPTLQGFVIQTNTTTKSFKSAYQDPNTFVQLPLQSAVHREIARYKLAQNPVTRSLADQLSWYIGLKTFAHPTIATVSVLGQVLGPFIFAACMFAFVTQIGVVVMEKEMGLRQAMRTMGMSDAAYWVSWMLWEVTMAFLGAHLIAIFGLILQFRLFLQNNYGLLFFLFFLFQLAMSSLALMCASFLSKTQTAVYLGFMIFLIGWIMQTVVIFGVPYAPDFWTTTGLSTLLTVLFSLCPWSLLVKGFVDLGSATVGSETPGLRWSERKRYCQNIPNLDDQSRWQAQNGYDSRTQYVSFQCVMSLQDIYGVLIALWLGYLVVAVYLDNVLKNEFGLRRPMFYFLMPSYWFPSALAPTAALEHVKREEGQGPEVLGDVDEDVYAEESRVRMLLNHRTGHTNKEGELAAAVDVRNAVEIFGLKKKFGGSRGCCGRTLTCFSACDCCSCKAADAFWPIKGTWLTIEQDQLFCLLGPNGAGKTTTINCLTGALPPTLGDALVYGQSIKSTGGMDKIRSLMGVCPQFDVLWPELTGIEHLCLYGRLKGCGWQSARLEANTLLEKVKLTYAATQRSGAYSGGMKRRLSVAIAMLGDPRVVYLDEPTTGMDPISRRYVWDIIQEAKVGRAIILTTHSMEEADILGDRIAIMALGRLRCLGSSLRLKQRFGSGYQVSVSVQPARQDGSDPVELERRENAVRALFSSSLALQPHDVGRVYTTYLVPREREPELIPFLAYLEQQAGALGITDIQLALTSLEEVFLSVARKAALEAAQSGGTSRKQDLPFCSTFLKASLIGLTLPLSIFAFPWWGRFLVGKRDSKGGLHATLPDGTQLLVEPGQELVTDPSGQTWAVVWEVDEGGHLVVREVKALDPASPQAAAGGMCYSAVEGKARVPLPGNVLLEVQVGNTYVMNPRSGETYQIQWGVDGNGKDAVVACTPTGPQVAAPVAGVYGVTASGTNSGVPPVAQYPAGMPVGQPVFTSPPYQNGAPVGEAMQRPMQLPGQIPRW